MIASASVLASAAWLDGSPKQILVTGEFSSPATQLLLKQVWSRYLPRRAVALIDTSSRPFFTARVPLVADLPAEEGVGATAYVCENFVCQMPTRDPAALAKLLAPVTPAKR